MSSRDEILALFERLGVATVPLAPRSKRPLRKAWQRADPGAWREAPADANVGVLTGHASGGLVVLDFDDIDLLHSELGMSPRSLAAHTLVVQTARGYHVYARSPQAPTRVPREGFSILGEGSLAVAPPSVHPSGAIYAFVAEPSRIALLTEFAAADLVSRPEPTMSEVSARSAAVDPSVLAPILTEEAFRIVSAQNEKVVAAWKTLTTAPPDYREFHGSGTDAWSRADFLIALCLIQHGCEPERVASLLLVLPGSKATVRGWQYATRTCTRAAQTARTGKLPGR